MNNLHIIGAGALGLTFAQQLSQQFTIHLQLKAHHRAPFFYTFNGQTEPIAAQSHYQFNAPIEQLWVFTKATDALSALRAALPYLSQKACVVLSHNGMTDLQPFLALLGKKRPLFFMTTTHGAYKTSPEQVIHSAQGTSTIGACNQAAVKAKHTYFTQWQQALTTLNYTDDIAISRWQKLLVNIAINPVAASHFVVNGTLRQPHYCSEIFALVNEAISVANQLGFAFRLSDSLTTAYQVMANTAKNRCSMLQDIEQQRQTEIDALCGYIIKKAQQLQLATPVNQRYFNKIKQLSAI